MMVSLDLIFGGLCEVFVKSNYRLVIWKKLECSFFQHFVNFGSSIVSLYLTYPLEYLYFGASSSCLLVSVFIELVYESPFE